MTELTITDADGEVIATSDGEGNFDPPVELPPGTYTIAGRSFELTGGGTIETAVGWT